MWVVTFTSCYDRCPFAWEVKEERRVCGSPLHSPAVNYRSETGASSHTYLHRIVYMLYVALGQLETNKLKSLTRTSTYIPHHIHLR